MLVHLKTLPLWDVAHYWHDLDPQKSSTHNLPTKVRDTLCVLSMWCSQNVAFRVDKDQAYLYEVAKKLPRFTARHYRHTFKKAIDSKVFGKRFFSGMHISRSKLARLCIGHNEPLPKFWFPDNEKYPFKLTGDISDETTHNGRYKLVTIYDDVEKTAEPEKDDAPVTTVASNASKAAAAKNAPINAIKDRFITFYHVDGKSSQMTAAARRFYSHMNEEDKKQFKHKDAAIRTLTEALSKHLKESKPAG